MTLKETQ